MNIATNYDAIKARAIALLTAPDGYNGYTVGKNMPETRWGLRTRLVGVALCEARDAIEPRFPITGAPRTPRGFTRFNTGNFNKAEGEIAKHICALKQKAQT